MARKDTKESSHKEILSNIVEQARDLCQIQDHSTRVIANLDIDENWFSGYNDPERAKFELKPVVLTVLYMHVHDLNQSEVSRRLQGSAYLWVRFGLKQPLSQQLISHNLRNRFNSQERQLLREAAARIRELGYEYDVRDTDEPALDPEDVKSNDIGEEKIMDAARLATELGFEEYTANRARNTKYALDTYFERQGYLNVTDAGSTSPRRRFARLSDRDEVPHGSSHYRTLRKIATPEAQYTFDEFASGERIPQWKRIRNELLPKFHSGVERILNEVRERDGEFQEPLHGAIDITAWEFWMSPFKSKKDITPDEEPTVIERNNELDEVYLKDEYPEMVSGLKESHRRGYKFATLTIVAQDTPIVLAIEPVRDNRWWETGEVETTSRGEIVDRLLEQASQHVDIQKVFADREFSTHEVVAAVERRGIQYVFAKKSQSNEDKKNIEEVMEDELTGVRVEWGSFTYEGREHNVSFIYLPSDGDGDSYSIFITNEWVDYDRAMALTSQYRQRWEIENQYKTIKRHFLPTTASSDYRIRLLYFVIGVTMYNVWRFTNFTLREAVDVDLGENPPISAGEIVEIIGFCLFDPGD